MKEVMNMLKEREKYLLKLKKEKERNLVGAPEGSLRINSNAVTKGGIRYYVRNDSKDFNGKYIKNKDKELAIKLAQKDYDEKLIVTANKELNAIKKYIMNYPKINVEQIYCNLHKERQKLITPVSISDEEYLKNWESYRYEGKCFEDGAPELFTEKNERVRSKSEVIIADALNRANIPYRYECPLELNNGYICYPDFTILHIRRREAIYWEHLGMMDDEKYAENAVYKIITYLKSGICLGKNLILTFETKNNPINHRMIDAMIENCIS